MTAQRPAPGDLIAGRYRLLKQLGAGGFGVVFHASQENMGRDIAIKLLQPKISNDPVAIERFRREAFHASGLRHPHTITLHDYGQDPDTGIFYIVMEYLEGEVLGKAVFKEGGLTLGRALRIGVQVLKSLGEAHRKGLVHRDLKPENIFLLEDVLGEQDYVKVLDFGLSKAVSDQQSTFGDPTLTQAGKVFGTPYYMSPEQAYGDDVTPAADVFAFGLLLYEMLVGQRPFRGKTAFDVLTKLTREPLPRLPPPLVGSCVQEYLDHLTEKELKDRYQDAVEALKPLERLLHVDAPDELGNIDQLYVGRKPNKRKAALAAARAEGEEEAKPRSLSPRHRANLSTRRVDAMPGGEPSPIEQQRDAGLAGLFAPEELAASMEQMAKSDHSDALPRSEGRDAQPRPPRMELEPDELTMIRSRPPDTPLTPEPGSRPAPSAPTPPPSKVRLRRHNAVDEAATVVHRPEVMSMSDDMPTVIRQMSGIVWSDIPFVGREAELNALSAWGRRTAEQLGGFLVIEGEAGVGKSRLMAELQLKLEHDSSRAQIGRGRYSRDGAGARSGLRDAIETLLDIRGTSDADAEIRLRKRLAELDIADDEQVLLNMLRPWRASEASPTFAIRAVPTAYRVLEQVLVRMARERPLILVLEDVHWADPLTIGFAEHLARSRSRGRQPSADLDWPLLCICTVRRSEMANNGELEGAVQRIGRTLGENFARMELPVLSPSGTDALVRKIMDLDDTLRQRVVQLSGGNPLHVLQLLRYLETLLMEEEAGRRPRGSTINSQIPDQLFALIEARAELMAETQRGAQLAVELLGFASILGFRFAHDLLESFLVHLGRNDMVQVLRALVADLQDQGFVERERGSDPPIYQFHHARIQSAMAERMRRTTGYRRLHEAAARAKESTGDGRGPTHSGAWLAEIANHWRETGNQERAQEFVVRQAQAVEHTWDLRTAQNLYRELEVELARDDQLSTVRFEVQLAIGRLATRQGELGPAEDMLQAAADTARRLENGRAEGKAMVLLGKLHTWQSRHQEALSCFKRAISCFSSLKNTTRIDISGLADAQYGQAEVARMRGNIGTAEDEFRRALEKAGQSHAPAIEAGCLQGVGRIEYVRGRLDDATTHLTQARDKFEEVGLAIEAATASADLALAQLHSHGVDKAEETAQSALSVFEITGERLAGAHARLHLGIVLSRTGALDRAQSHTMGCLEVFRSLHHTYGVAKATLLRAELAALTDNDDEVRQFTREALRVHEGIGDAQGSALCLLFAGRWAADTGRHDEAEEQVSNALDILEGGGLLLYRPLCRAQIGRVAEARGQVDVADRYYQEAYNEANKCNNREVASYCSTLLGALALTRGRAAKARGFLETGLTSAQRLSAVTLQVPALFFLVWLEGVAGKHHSSARLSGQLAKVVNDNSQLSFRLDRLVARTIRTIELVRGRSDAKRFQRAADAVMDSLTRRP